MSSAASACWSMAGRSGISFEEFRSDVPALRAKDTHQRLGAAGTAIESDAADFVDGFLGDEQQAAHGFLRSDGKIRKNDQAVDALKLDGGNDGDVHFAGPQRFRTLRRHGEGKLIFAAQRAVREATDERRGVQILHNRDAERIHVVLSRK